MTPSLSLEDQLRAAVPDTDERENDFGDNEDEPDPDCALLAAAVPGADPRDVENAITGLQYRKHRGEIYTTVRAYLRAVIKKGDARSLVDDAAAERRRSEIDLAPFGGPFGGPPSAAASQAAADAFNGTAPGRVVAGEVVVQPDVDVRPAGTPETRMPVPLAETPSWRTVKCPACDAGPGEFCRYKATGGHAATHQERRRAASETAAA